jgi:hypothetical protein
MGVQGHRLPAVGSIEAIVFPAERDAVVVWRPRLAEMLKAGIPLPGIALAAPALKTLSSDRSGGEPNAP